ncbi:restriction endonuclease subunit S [Deltaproteobacteria bacterium TL4]
MDTTREPKENDILFSYETRLGEASIVPKGFRCCLGRRMGLLRIKFDHVEPKFLLYYYLVPQFQTIIRERTVFGTTVDRIPLIDMPRFPIFLPPLPEQRAIASVLSSLDDKIDLLHRQNKTLEAMAETLFRQWFVEEAQWNGTLSEYIKVDMLLKVHISKKLVIMGLLK